jgi:hypothetical protein
MPNNNVLIVPGFAGMHRLTDSYCFKLILEISKQNGYRAIPRYWSKNLRGQLCLLGFLKGYAGRRSNINTKNEYAKKQGPFV